MKTILELNLKYAKPETKITNERQLVLSDILSLVNSTEGIKKKVAGRNGAVFLSPYKLPDLYVLLSKMKQSKNPAALFWWTVKSNGK